MADNDPARRTQLLGWLFIATGLVWSALLIVVVAGHVAGRMDDAPMTIFLVIMFAVLAVFAFVGGWTRLRRGADDSDK